MDKERKVVFCGNFQFPEKNAAGKRVLGLGRIFKSLGYESVFIGVDDFKDENLSFEYFEDFKSVPVRKSATIKEWLEVKTVYSDYQQRLEELDISTISYLVIYGSPVISIWVYLIIAWAKRNKIKVLFDCVDWIESSGRGGVFDFIKFFDTNLQKRCFALKADGVITISRYLSDYYQSKSMSTVLIPPVGKKSELAYTQSLDNKKVHVVYAGFFTSAKKQVDPSMLKDRLDIAIDICLGLLDKGIDLQFDIYGTTMDQYILAIPRHHNLREISNISFYGIQDRDTIDHAIVNADFTILIRDDNIVSRAGFPTKVSESLLLGTPVIVNNFGDVEDYVVDGINGIVVERDSSQAIQKLSLVLSEQTSFRQLKRNIKDDATFDYALYVSVFDQFLQSL